MSTTSGATPQPKPLYVVYGYRRDADEFARERGIPRWDVIAVTEGHRKIRGVKRPIVMVDTDHHIRKAMEWHEMSEGARVINATLGVDPEPIFWARR